MKNPLKAALRPTVLAAGALLTTGGWLSTPAVRAADPYDKSLETRVEALERELNILSNDSKGKNVSSTEVPTFVRASKNVQELTFSAEMRLRYEYGDVSAQAVQANATSSRERIRFRLFADYKLSDQFFAGAAVQTSIAADSGNTTFSEGFDNYTLYLWRAFIGWKSKDGNIKITAGKLPNPLYADTELLWDADISPTGLSEQIKIPISSEFELALNAGQYAFYDNAENAYYNNVSPTVTTGGVTTANPNYVARNADNNQDAYLLTQQLVATFKPSNRLTLTGAGGYQFYLGHGGTNSPGANNPPPTTVGAGNGQGQAGNVLQNSAAFNSANATRDLSLVFGSADVKFDLGAIKLKVYGDGVYNFQGGHRVSREYNLPALANDTNKVAFSTGVTVGSDYTIKKKGDYLLLAEYRQVGLGALDPNLNDSDWNFSRLGFRGVKAAASYGFFPWLIGTVTYYNGFNLGVDKNVNIGVDNVNATQIIQVDLTAKF